MPRRPQMKAPVGKSGPVTMLSSTSWGRSGFSISAMVASTTSRRLWGGMLVAIPTAMPELPLTSRLGARAGSTVGSSMRPSKLGMKSTVSSSMSVSSWVASGVSRASV